jgi:D-threo-aldose 1-dehydrogenase
MHPAVVSTIPGARTSSEVIENINMIDVDIPSGVWDTLKSENLIPLNAPTN